MTFEFAPTTSSLPEVLDLNAAAPLAARLLALRGGAVTLDASQVTRFGGLCLQVMLAARAAWRADGNAFQVSGRSQAFDEALALFGAAGFDAAPEARP